MSLTYMLPPLCDKSQSFFRYFAAFQSAFSECIGMSCKQVKYWRNACQAIGEEDS